MPTPCVCAEDNCSISPSYARISVSRERTTTASSCSSSFAHPTMRSPIASRSATLSSAAALMRHLCGGSAPTPQHGRLPGGRSSVAALARSTRSCGGAPNGQRLHAERRDAVADRNALAVLAAHAWGPHGEVVPDGLDHGEHFGAVADEVALA